jgi:hypothetical protein
VNNKAENVAIQLMAALASHLDSGHPLIRKVGFSSVDILSIVPNFKGHNIRIKFEIRLFLSKCYCTVFVFTCKPLFSFS